MPVIGKLNLYLRTVSAIAGSQGTKKMLEIEVIVVVFADFWAYFREHCSFSISYIKISQKRDARLWILNLRGESN